MQTELLKELGLSDAETKIYIALLKKNNSTISEISHRTGLHRTNVYDYSEKLKEKGLVSFHLESNKKILRALDPESLLDYLKEKEYKITQLIPELKSIQNKSNEKVIVEIFKGKQGIKTVIKDILQKKEEVIGNSVAGQLRKYLPEFSEYYFREQQKKKIKHKFIFTTGTDNPFTDFYEIRYLPKEFESQTFNLCYGNTLLNIIWEPEMIAIRIISKEIADNYTKHFNLLWKTAKKQK